MDDSALMRVLDALAQLLEQLESLDRRQSFPIAVLGDRHADHVLHRRSRGVRPPCPRRSTWATQGIHHRQGLTLGLEARNDLPAVETGLDQLERDAPPHGSPARPLHLAHAAFAENS